MESKIRMGDLLFRRQYNLYGDPAVNLWPTGFTVTENMTLSGTVDISTNMTIPSGITLTILPGAVLRFAEGASLTVNGRLVANSTDPNNRITFTGTTAAPGFWNGIIINSGSSTNVNTLRRCDVEYANDGITINYTGVDNKVTVDKCRIRYNNYNGIYVTGLGYGASSEARISSNTISNNGENGISLANYAKPAIVINRIENNTASGIYAASYNSARVDSNYIFGFTTTPVTKRNSPAPVN